MSNRGFRFACFLNLIRQVKVLLPLDRTLSKLLLVITIVDLIFVLQVLTVNFILGFIGDFLNILIENF